jgi:hypothetical protein
MKETSPEKSLGRGEIYGQQVQKFECDSGLSVFTAQFIGLSMREYGQESLSGCNSPHTHKLTNKWILCLCEAKYLEIIS